ncbi:hypothetical protein AB434_0034 [Heyndrickxia coagulans]|uniref:Uncharacterized protein n=1 Tax=Heyndrickxia coagulans TaxID=1398 RepID=A0AAN0T387_HEYCO|nr:hypothetical protein SB48_HM08orf01767 [Heyndrickxia coagulans]AKN52439.1 hypothetical protein AB434_0034 [Heyndrickxia coagulans]KYC65654.1 hypothetical protein B4100_2427 [Heyndrickxia coagulans]KYC79310.1 hypothetical protein B4096_2345 [Heyndrickxia coagulans]
MKGDRSKKLQKPLQNGELPGLREEIYPQQLRFKPFRLKYFREITRE